MTDEQLLKAYRDAYKNTDTSKPQQQPQTQQVAKPAAPKK